MIFLATQNPGRFLIGISYLAVNLETDVHSLLMPDFNEPVESAWSPINSEEGEVAIKLPFSSFAVFCFGES